MPYTTAEARQELLDEFAEAIERIGPRSLPSARRTSSWTSTTRTGSRPSSSDPFSVPTAAKSTHAQFAERHGLPGRSSTKTRTGHSVDRAKRGSSTTPSTLPPRPTAPRRAPGLVASDGRRRRGAAGGARRGAELLGGMGQRARTWHARSGARSSTVARSRVLRSSAAALGVGALLGLAAAVAAPGLRWADRARHLRCRRLASRSARGPRASILGTLLRPDPAWGQAASRVCWRRRSWSVPSPSSTRSSTPTARACPGDLPRGRSLKTP